MRFSHMFRYSCQHSHLRGLHDGFPCRFDDHTTLPYSSAMLSRNAIASVLRLSPVTLSAQPRLTSELLRTL
jgi:hypothetical protein